MTPEEHRTAWIEAEYMVMGWLASNIPLNSLDIDFNGSGKASNSVYDYHNHYYPTTIITTNTINSNIP